MSKKYHSELDKIPDSPLGFTDVEEVVGREIEYGHGRKRSLEWNAGQSEKLREEIAELKERRQKDDIGDNEFDGQAMK